MPYDSLELRSLQLLLVLFQELMETSGTGIGLEVVACLWGISSRTIPHPASPLCFLAHHGVDLAAPPSETVHPNKAFLSVRISHRDRNETKGFRWFLFVCFNQNVRSGRVFENDQQSTLESLTGKSTVTICRLGFTSSPWCQPY